MKYNRLEPNGFLILITLVLVAGWFMNFQNIFEYSWPASEFIASVIGVFVFPLGVFMGFIF